MAQQGSKQPAPAALAVQHLARAAAASSSPALSAVLGRRMLQVAASAGQSLPRGTARPCPHCGAFNAEGVSQVLKLPRRAVRRELEQQAAAQARGRGSGQPISRWVAATTCTVCGQEIRRRLQQQPGQQQQQREQEQQPTAVGKAAHPKQQPAMQQQQPALQPHPQAAVVGQPAAPGQQPRMAQQQQQQQQPAEKNDQQDAAAAAAAAAAGQQQGRTKEESSQGGEEMLAALLQGGELAALPLVAEQAAASTQPEAGGIMPEAAAEQQVAGQRDHAGSALPLADGGNAGQPATMAWAAVQEAWGLQPSQLEGPHEAQLPTALLPAAPAASPEEDADEAGGADNSGDGAATPGGAADAGPPRKRRRLSWSDDLQQVKLIDRAPRPQLRKVYSWHRLARSWKAASFKLG